MMAGLRQGSNGIHNIIRAPKENNSFPNTFIFYLIYSSITDKPPVIMFSIEAQQIAMRTIDTEISRLEEIIRYIFTNKLLSAEALQMRERMTYLYVDGDGHLVPHNERLEQIGDRVLDTVLAKAWYEARDEHGTANNDGPVENHLTQTGNPRTLDDHSNMQKDLVTNKALGARGHRLGLNDCVIKGWGTTRVGIPQMANCFEAIIGAVYMDAGANGLNLVRAMLEHLGFFEHPILSVTLCDSPPFAFRNIQLLTNVLNPSSLTWGAPGASTRRSPGWLIGGGSFLSLECA
jgi:ribonuclease-3